MRKKQSEITVLEYQTPSGSALWKVDTMITVNGKKHRIRHQGFSSRADAVVWGEHRAAEVRLGIGVEAPREARRRAKDDPARWTTDQVFEKLLERWKDRLKPISIYSYTSAYRSHIKPVCGSTVFAEISEMQKKVIEKDTGQIAAVFRTMLRDAPKVKAILPPIVFDPPPRKRNPRIVWFEPEEVTAIREVLPEHYRAVFTFLVSTGLRLSEMLGLSWCDLDQRRNIMHVRRSLVLAPGPVFCTPKSGKARHVPLSETALEALREQSRRVHGIDWPDVPNGADPEKNLVFPLDRASFRVAMVKAGEALHLGKQCSPHVCRHTCASLMVQRGVKLEVVCQILGHKDLATTLIYAHLAPKHLATGLDVLSDALKVAV